MGVYCCCDFPTLELHRLTYMVCSFLDFPFYFWHMPYQTEKLYRRLYKGLTGYEIQPPHLQEQSKVPLPCRRSEKIMFPKVRSNNIGSIGFLKKKIKKLRTAALGTHLYLMLSPIGTKDLKTKSKLESLLTSGEAAGVV